MLCAAIVEDDLDQARLVASWIKSLGYQASLFVSAELFMAAQEKGQSFDLILVDWFLPGMSGLELVQLLAQQVQRPPIIFMTRLQHENELAQALHSGADDFISKPLSKTVLLARVYAVMRRHQPVDLQAPHTEMSLDVATLTLNFRGQDVKLTASECRLMQLFLHSSDCLFSREDLADSLWGDSEKAHQGRALDLAISRLRKKLSLMTPPLGDVVNHYAQGYRFVFYHKAEAVS
ncbi:response regulator transcription factor [Marinospirillum sp.]|uniref:response regulator transcription factor n=1 Tax=Marinospirillum sp. TaxID=2183934 RepID=UPI003A87F3FD